MPGLRLFSFSVGERKIMNHFVVSRPSPVIFLLSFAGAFLLDDMGIELGL
jgi:hypothetical protein